MSRLSCITELRECEAMSIVQRAINDIRDWNDRWGDHTRANDPEEWTKTLRILGRLIELDADEVQRATREGEAMNIRRVTEAQSNDTDDTDDTDPTPPAVSAAIPHIQQEMAA